MDKPIYRGFAVSETSKLIKYETYCDELQPYFGEKNIQLHYMDTDSFILSFISSNIIKNFQNLNE